MKKPGPSSQSVSLLLLFYVHPHPLALCSDHANGEEGSPLVAFEFAEIKEAIAIEAEVNKVSWLDLFRTPGNRRRVRIIVR